MRRRRSRAARPPRARFLVTSRDRIILHAVGRMGQATTAQVRRLFFSDPSTASRRLSKLIALRLLNVHVRDLAEPNIYTLARAGIDLLRASGVDRDELHVARVGRHVDEHLGAINDLRVELVLASRRDPSISVDAFHSDLDLRRIAGSATPSFVPDAVVEIATPSGRLALVVEIDLGTEGRLTFAAKVDATVALWKNGGPCWGALAGSWRPAVFVPSEARGRALARTIVERGGGALWLVAELPRLREVGGTGAIFATAESVAATPCERSVAYSGRLVGS